MKQTVLLIDAGHGGIDQSGNYTTAPTKQHKYTQGFHNNGWFYEGVSNRRIAAEFIAQASRMGFLCVPVYHPSKDTPLINRTNIANEIAVDLQAQDCIYISFHSDAFNSTARGWTIFHHPNSGNGKTIAESINDQVSPLLSEFGTTNRGVRTANYHVLTYTSMPAVLIENLFFDNEHDAELLQDPTFCVNLCNRILRGIEKIAK